MSQKILVTGATGNVGQEVARLLRERNQPLRAAVISEADAQNLPDPDIERRLFDFGDPATYPAAFKGVERLFLMRPPAISDVDKYIKPVLDYAGRSAFNILSSYPYWGLRRTVMFPIIRSKRS